MCKESSLNNVFGHCRGIASNGSLAINVDNIALNVGTWIPAQATIAAMQETTPPSKRRKLSAYSARHGNTSTSFVLAPQNYNMLWLLCLATYNLCLRRHLRPQHFVLSCHSIFQGISFISMYSSSSRFSQSADGKSCSRFINVVHGSAPWVYAQCTYKRLISRCSQLRVFTNRVIVVVDPLTSFPMCKFDVQWHDGHFDAISVDARTDCGCRRSKPSAAVDWHSPAEGKRKTKGSHLTIVS